MRNKTLLIVESPAKAKTINKYLGSGYVVEASVGHIKDLVKINLGVDVNNNFKPKYITIKGKSQIVKKLKQLSEQASNVLIATDPDREGEAIAWHIAEEVREKNKNIKRVLFNEITKTGIKRGIEHPLELNENLFMSQQARRVMDRLIGFQVSPFLSRAMLDKTTNTLSAGRVQSVALRLICEREEEIRNFVPIEYWSISGDFETDSKQAIKARLVALDGDNIKNPEGSAGASTEEARMEIQEKLAKLNFIHDQNEANNLVAQILKENYKISNITKKEVRRKPLSPFTTSLLQQEASKRLGFSNKRTMSVAQKLYEGVSIGSEGLVGLITYMRTDSVRISPDAEKAAADFINTNFGAEYVPEKTNVFTSKSSNVQDAHEAIRPTTLDHAPKEVRKYLTKEEAALYELIYNRFLASQMKSAILEQTTVEIEGGRFLFRVTGSVIIFKGFLIVYEDENGDENKDDKDLSLILPKSLSENIPLAILDAQSNQSFTKPSARFTEASIVKELDELGIGRPSTYAQIITTLQEREYVELNKKSFQSTELGEQVNEVLVKHFPDLFNVDFTREMESELDTIGEGEKTYEDVMHEFYGPFIGSLNKAEGMGDIPEIICDKCGLPMTIKVSRNGRFLACTGYPDCKNTKPIPKAKKENIEKAEPVIAEGVTCDLCGNPMYIREGKFGKFYGCTDYPKCKGIKQMTTGIACPKCHDGKLSMRYSKKTNKKFYGCTRYPDCDYLTKYEPVNQPCPSCKNYYVELRYRKVEEGFEKYLKCPSCSENFEL
ncbi:MAG: topA [Ignavibacteria bacterium]|nr:topA [Ignavibacteria bacterium]